MEKPVAELRLTDVRVTNNGTTSGPGAAAKNQKNYVIRAVDGHGLPRAWGLVATDELDAYNRFRLYMAERGVTIG